MIAGHARIVKDQVTRQAVAKACGDAVDTGDVFELTIERAMLKTREKGKPVYTKWKSARENSDRGESLIEECKVRYTHPHLDDLAVGKANEIDEN